MENKKDSNREMSESGKIKASASHKTPKTNSGLALTLSILGFFVPVVGLVLAIIGIVLGSKAKRINPDDGMALAAIIIGYITVFLPIIAILAFIVFYMTFAGLQV